MNIAAKIIFIMVLAVLSPIVYAQEYDNYYDDDYYNEYDPDKTKAAPPDTGNKVFLAFNYGATASWLTRIINQKERSNFVFKDFLPGLYFTAKLHNVKYITPAIRLAAYYPMTSTFNEVPQKPKTTAHFGADMLAGVQFDVSRLSAVHLNLGPAFHMFFLNSDRWNYLNMGAAAVLGIEVPLDTNWTFLIGGYASLDSGNLGGNRKMEPFDTTYQYQVDIGVRFSTKKLNTAVSQKRAETKPTEGSYEEDYYKEANEEEEDNDFAQEAF